MFNTGYSCLSKTVLTHWYWDKMADIFQTTFLMHFLKWQYINFDWVFIEMCSQWSNKQYSCIGSDKALAPVRRQAIKPLSEPIMVCLMTHTCVSRPQWVNPCERRTVCFLNQESFYLWCSNGNHSLFSLWILCTFTDARLRLIYCSDIQNCTKHIWVYCFPILWYCDVKAQFKNIYSSQKCILNSPLLGHVYIYIRLCVWHHINSIQIKFIAILLHMKYRINKRQVKITTKWYHVSPSCNGVWINTKYKK